MLPSVNVELILCNQRVNKKMCVRYVMIDPEFFILIEPDFSVPSENRIIIHQKVELKYVESKVDRNDPRNLLIGYAVFSSQHWDHRRPGEGENQPQFKTEHLLLYFENQSKCSYVKNMLDHTKLSFKKQQTAKVLRFLD